MICRTYRPQLWCRSPTANEHLSHVVARWHRPGGGERIAHRRHYARQPRGPCRQFIFLPLPGRRVHGLKFAAEAASKGATVVLWEPCAEADVPKLPAAVFTAAIPNLSQLVGRIADRFFNWPSSQLRITGITGTNGKTTSAYLLTQCLDSLGSCAAYMGTIGWGAHRRTGPAHAHHSRCGDGAPQGWRSCAPRACARWRWRCPLKPWIRIEWRACAFIRLHSSI